MTDNGPELTSHPLGGLLTRLGFGPLPNAWAPPLCPTAPPEAFFGNPKRDYVAHHEVESAAQAAARLPG